VGDNGCPRQKSLCFKKEKLKVLKEALKSWNKAVFGILDLNIGKTVKDLNDVEELLANGDGDQPLLNSKELVKKFWEQLHSKESLIRQKSRTKWIQEGDSNSRFFHASIKACQRCNNIFMLKRGDEWIKGVSKIKNEAKEHFSKQFLEEWSSRPFLNSLGFNSLSEDDNALLLAPFDEAEVKETIWSCNSNKSPGPDDFNINFFKSCWSIVK
jgi:hypothetical protein